MSTLALTLCLIFTTWPLRTEVTKGVDGDGRADKLVYEVKPWEPSIRRFVCYQRGY